MDGLLYPECGCPEGVVYDDGTCECQGCGFVESIDNFLHLFLTTMVLVISILLLVLAIIQMVIYYRFGINFLKPMNRHDWKRITPFFYAMK